jgi:hypothetical protein
MFFVKVERKSSKGCKFFIPFPALLGEDKEAPAEGPAK